MITDKTPKLIPRSLIFTNEEETILSSYGKLLADWFLIDMGFYSDEQQEYVCLMCPAVEA
jgi:hypothetical protein